MTGLLVSVRSGSEAESALAGGAAVIDIKEPLLGPLGRAAPSVWGDVCRRVGQQCPVSVALGELLQDGPGDALAELPTVRWAKIGLAACRDVDDWPQRWSRLVNRLPPTVAAVGVVYADHDRAAAPEPEEILSCAAEVRCSTLLIDTFDKSAGGLFDVMPGSRINQIVRAARDRCWTIVLAGSLNQNSIERALALEPDLVAVRGAACRGSRSGKIDSGRVRALAQLVAGARSHSA